MAISQVTYYVCDVCKKKSTDINFISSVPILGLNLSEESNNDYRSVYIDMCKTCKSKLYMVIKNNFIDLGIKDGVIMKKDIVYK